MSTSQSNERHDFGDFKLPLVPLKRSTLRKFERAFGQKRTLTASSKSTYSFGENVLSEEEEDENNSGSDYDNDDELMPLQQRYPQLKVHDEDDDFFAASRR